MLTKCGYNLPHFIVILAQSGLDDAATSMQPKEQNLPKVLKHYKYFPSLFSRDYIIHKP